MAPDKTPNVTTGPGRNVMSHHSADRKAQKEFDEACRDLSISGPRLRLTGPGLHSDMALDDRMRISIMASIEAYVAYLDHLDGQSHHRPPR